MIEKIYFRRMPSVPLARTKRQSYLIGACGLARSDSNLELVERNKLPDKSDFERLHRRSFLSFQIKPTVQ